MAGKFEISSTDDKKFDRMEMVKAFDETKAGVKGLLDSGLTKIPKIFVRPSEEVAKDQLLNKRIHVQIPLIDLGFIWDPENRKKIVEQLRVASETFGFFQIVNHGIPSAVLDEMIDGIRRFNELDVEEKKKYYSRDIGRNVRYMSNFDLYKSRTASWRDTLQFMFSDQIDEQELPVSCRNNTIEYAKHLKILGNSLFGLLSEALGLKPNHLQDMECSKGHRFSCHYYPACPEPELTLGAIKHTDPCFLTILLQSQIVSCLQVLYQGQWIDIQPIRGGLVVNIGDLLQLVSNGKFKSSEHRVIANSIGPRISVAYFLSGPAEDAKIYGPIKELVSEENPKQYTDVQLSEFFQRFSSIGLDKFRALDYYKL